jgi:hypothetical protein
MNAGGGDDTLMARKLECTTTGRNVDTDRQHPPHAGSSCPVQQFIERSLFLADMEMTV